MTTTAEDHEILWAFIAVPLVAIMVHVQRHVPLPAKLTAVARPDECRFAARCPPTGLQVIVVGHSAQPPTLLAVEVVNPLGAPFAQQFEKDLGLY